MPKMKTHSGAAKRFKVNGKGKIRRKKAYHSHILTKKSAKRKRNLRASVEVHPGDNKRMRRLLHV